MRVRLEAGTTTSLLGERAASFLGTSVGRQIPIGHGVFRVSGIIRTRNGFEDGGVFMPLAAAQRFFHKEGLSVITIKLQSSGQTASFKRQVHGAVP